MKRLVVLLAVLVVAVCVTACATTRSTPQPTAAGGTLTGVVLAADGFPMAGVTVTVSTRGQKAQSQVTDVDGTYDFQGLASGTYTVMLYPPGSEPQRYDNVRVTASQGAALETVLPVYAV